MRKFLIVIIIIVICFFGISLWWSNGLSAIDPKDTSPKMFVIPKGEAIRNIGNKLKSEGLIRDPVAFFIYIKINNLDHAVQAGTYRLSSAMDLVKIMDTLGHGTLDIWVTVPEGLRAEEIAQILKDNIPSYQDLWEGRLKLEEGYLFPDTYLIPKDATIDSIISIFENNFYQKIGTLELSKNTPGLRRIVTIASLIEREAKFTEDRPNVSSVIVNRLNIGMALQIDATVQYALGYNPATNKWWSQPSPAQIKIPSPYNTYINTGFPPTPICNPGLSAIEAAAKPADTNYIYYVNDSKGRLHFSTNIEDHNKNIQKYLN